ncbi:unnamed protein product [Sphenostylis stenocarpa]|uniref:Uncharacterized protein n=1 Tax=Sphenostylis stenocarpa TaxID=92480 RepID=A0AA86TFF7_9FABA|nr:unnamed protein product [Sphenostylis stenocarpa]
MLRLEGVIWRSQRKSGLIKQFLKDVYWGQLDFLIVDAPPGTSYRHIYIVQCLDTTGVDGAIIVTIPQQVSLIDNGRTHPKIQNAPHEGILEKKRERITNTLTDIDQSNIE